MRRYEVTVLVSLRNGILDPQGQAVTTALHSLGFANVNSVRVGKLFILTLEAENSKDARAKAKAICEKSVDLLNPIMEAYEVVSARKPR